MSHFKAGPSQHLENHARHKACLCCNLFIKKKLGLHEYILISVKNMVASSVKHDCHFPPAYEKYPTPCFIHDNRD